MSMIIFLIFFTNSVGEDGPSYIDRFSAYDVDIVAVCDKSEMYTEKTKEKIAKRDYCFPCSQNVKIICIITIILNT